MNPSAEIAQSLLNISVAAFFSADPTALSTIEWKLSSREFRGLAINALSEINVTQRDSLPLLLASQFTALRDWEKPLADNLALVMFDHGTAEVTVAKPFEDSDGKHLAPEQAEDKPKKPIGDAATGVATAVSCVDIRKLFSLDWRVRRVSLVAVSFDVMSNETDVSLMGGAELPLTACRQITPVTRADGTGLPSFDPAAVGVKPVPDGVAFNVGVEQTPANIVVRGSLATIAQTRHLASANVAPHSVSAKSLKVVAVVPVTLLFAGKNWRVPWSFDWGIPVYAEAASPVGSRLSAAFAIPLPKEKMSLLASGEYVAYIMLEGRLFGPQKFTIPPCGR